MQGLQKICDILTENPSWSLAHLVVYFNMIDYISDSKVLQFINYEDHKNDMSPFQVINYNIHYTNTTLTQ